MTPSNAIIKSNAAGLADLFFGREPIETDWDYFLNNPQTIETTLLVQELEALQPVPLANPAKHRIFVIQQKLRIAFRYQKLLPLLSEKTCGYCGTRKADSVLCRCLYCAELNVQFDGYGSRGSMMFVAPCFDPKMNSWGLLYYRSFGRDSNFMLWIALGYSSWREASLALYPITKYEEWISIQTNGLANTCNLHQHLLRLDDLMEMSLPLSPEEFRTLLYEKINQDAPKEQHLERWGVSRAIRDYEREQSQ
jgi:hypothetical protein